MPVEVKKKLPNGSALLSNGNVITPIFRVSFPHLFHKNVNKKFPNRKPTYQLTQLYGPGEDMALLKSDPKAWLLRPLKESEEVALLRYAVLQAVKEKYGEPAKWPTKFRYPFLDQAEGEYEGYTAGQLFVRSNSDQKPGVVNVRNEYIADESEIYPGCFGRATLRAYCYDNESRGVALGLQNFQKVRDGESLGGRMKAEDEFTPIEGGDDVFGETPATDPLASMEG